MTGYFSNFGNVVWSNTSIVNITERVGISPIIQNGPWNFYPLNIPSGLRADRVAQAYYGDPYFAWLVYVSANIIDPYYGWPLDAVAFNDYITAKYGSTTLAMQQIMYWSLNWAPSSDEIISVAEYNGLESNIVKYYEPVFSLAANVVGYRLRREDWTETTNQFISMTINTHSGNGFILDEPVQVVATANVVIGNAQVCWVNSTSVTVQHITGNVTANNTSLVGVISNSVANITSQGNMVYNISLDEQEFWYPVSCFEYEQNKNSNNQHILLVDSKYSGAANGQLQALLNSNNTLKIARPVLQALTGF